MCERDELVGAGAETMRWHQGAVKLRYAVEGTAGPSLVLFHELGGSMEHWDDVVLALKKDFRVLRYDLRGAGQSGTPQAEYNIENGHLPDLLELLKVTGLEPPYHFASAASGAVVPVMFALKSPMQVSSITLLAPALGISDPMRKQSSIERARIAIERGMEAVTDSSLAISYPEKMRLDKARFDRLRSTMIRTDPRGFAYGSYALVGSMLEARLGELDVPVQFLAGRHDDLRTPDYVRSLAAKVKSASFEEVESGHFMHVQTPLLATEKIRRWIYAHSGSRDSQAK